MMRVCMRAAHHAEMQTALRRQIIEIAATAEDEALIRHTTNEAPITLVPSR
jgi:hypothetical protein